MDPRACPAAPPARSSRRCAPPGRDLRRPDQQARLRRPQKCARIWACPDPAAAGRVFGVEDTPWIKPQPAFTQYALQQLQGRPPADTVLVGDSPFDVATTARAGGLAFVGVTTGTHTAEELKIAGAGRIAADLAGVARELGLERVLVRL